MPVTPRVFTDRRLPDDVRQAFDTLAALPGVVGLAVMPDAHATGSPANPNAACVGTVLATTDRLYPTVLGGDLGCGIRCVPFNTHADALQAPDGPPARAVLRRLQRLVPTQRHRRADAPPLRLRNGACSDATLDRALARAGPSQLGTIGGGNHFVELQRDDTGQLWAMIHTGSRGFGQAVAAHHRDHPDGTARGAPFLHANSPRGRAFLHDLRRARAYARLNRAAIADAVAFALHDVLGTRPLPGAFDTDHNHARRERHAGRWLWVHRKGAAPAYARRPLPIPGSMGTFSVHAQGLAHPDAFASSPHGAGRRLTRGEASRVVTPDHLAAQLRHVCHDPRLPHIARDESPDAYRDLHAVLRDARPLARVTRRLTPVLIHKG